MGPLALPGIVSPDSPIHVSIPGMDTREGGGGVDVADAAATLAPIEVNVQVGQRRDAMGRMAPKCDVAQCRSNSKGGPTALPPLHSGPARAAQASEVASGGDLNASPVRHRHDFNSDNPKLLSRATRSINIGVLSRYIYLHFQRCQFALDGLVASQ